MMGGPGHCAEWIVACKGSQPAGSNEATLLGAPKEGSSGTGNAQNLLFSFAAGSISLPV
jgi:hypothetical protein